MKKQNIFIAVSINFSKEIEAKQFCRELIESKCGFTPLIKRVENEFIVCRQFRASDPSDQALYFLSETNSSDGEELLSWIHLEEMK